MWSRRVLSCASALSSGHSALYCAHQYPQLRGGRGFDRTKLELALAEKIAELDFDGDEPLAQNYTVHHTLVDLPSKVEIYCGDLCW